MLLHQEIEFFAWSIVYPCKSKFLLDFPNEYAIVVPMYVEKVRNRNSRPAILLREAPRGFVSVAVTPGPAEPAILSVEGVLPDGHTTRLDLSGGTSV